MKFARKRTTVFVWVVLVTAFVAGAKFAADPPAPPKVSAFAPAADLMAQVEYYKKRMQDVVASEADFDEAKQTRITKDAHTVAVLVQHLGMHDAENPVKKSAAAALKAAQDLTAATDFKSASAGYANLEKALAGSAEGGELKWGKVAAMGQLMKQVSVVNAALKRGLQPTRLKSQAKKTAGESALLAAIANSLLYDTHEVKSEGDLPDWYAYSAEFRDSAGALNAAIKTGQIAKVTPALKRMSTSCDTCHSKFQKEQLITTTPVIDD
jgi:cytochrome c556